jgi:hypothetical protein
VRARSSTSARPTFAHVTGEDSETVLGDILGMARDEIRGLFERQVLR